MAIRKDYKAIADIISQEYIRQYTDEREALAISRRGSLGVCRVALNIADYFATQSEFFSRRAFLDACGIEG